MVFYLKHMTIIIYILHDNYYIHTVAATAGDEYINI